MKRSSNLRLVLKPSRNQIYSVRLWNIYTAYMDYGICSLCPAFYVPRLPFCMYALYSIPFTTFFLILHPTMFLLSGRSNISYCMYYVPTIFYTSSCILNPVWQRIAFFFDQFLVIMWKASCFTNFSHYNEILFLVYDLQYFLTMIMHKRSDKKQKQHTAWIITFKSSPFSF